MASPKLDKTRQRLREESRISVPPPAGELDIGGPLGVRIERATRVPCSAVFYDEDAETLTVHLMPFDPYDSFLELGHCRIDTDGRGRPVFIEVVRRRGDWQVDPGLLPPECSRTGSLCFRQTRRRHSPPNILTDCAGAAVCLRFLARRGDQVIRVAENLVAEVGDGFLVALWIAGVERDFGERLQGQWRAETAARLRKTGHPWQNCSDGRVSMRPPISVRRQFFP